MEKNFYLHGTSNVALSVLLLFSVFALLCIVDVFLTIGLGILLASLAKQDIFHSWLLDLFNLSRLSCDHYLIYTEQKTLEKEG